VTGSGRAETCSTSRTNINVTMNGGGSDVATQVQRVMRRTPDMIEQLKR
jgi:hypothetical protein